VTRKEGIPRSAVLFTTESVVSAMLLKARTIETKATHRKSGQTDVCIRSFISRWIKDSSFAV